MTNSLKLLLVAVPALSQVLPAWAQQRAPVERPNILMIVADDMNWDSPGCFGGAAPEITPNIDRLAAGGMRFEHAYVNIAVCTPSRSVMLTDYTLTIMVRRVFSGFVLARPRSQRS